MACATACACFWENLSSCGPCARMYRLPNQFPNRVTDLVGGSVNTTFAQFVQKRNFYLVTGVNLGLVIDLLTIDGRNIEEEIRFAVERNRKAMQFCNPLFESVKNSVTQAQNV